MSSVPTSLVNFKCTHASSRAICGASLYFCQVLITSSLYEATVPAEFFSVFRKQLLVALHSD